MCGLNCIPPRNNNNTYLLHNRPRTQRTTMNAVASSSAPPLYMTPGRKSSSGYDYLAPSAGYTPWANPNTVQYDHRGRLQPYVETSEQRRARAEFLRKREFSRRINAWIQGSSPEVRPSSLFFLFRLRCADACGLNQSSGSKSSDTDSLRTIDEDDETEPEIIYSTSPSASRWTAASPPNGRPLSRHLRASSRTSSMSSLSSISEEESV